MTNCPAGRRAKLVVSLDDPSKTVRQRIVSLFKIEEMNCQQQDFLPYDEGMWVCGIYCSICPSCLTTTSSQQWLYGFRLEKPVNCI